MVPSKHHLTDLNKQIDVSLFSGDQWIPIEVRENLVDDVDQASCFPLQGLVSRVRSDRSASEVFGHKIEDFPAVSILTDRNTGSNLPPHPDSGSRTYCDGKASFTVEIAGNVRLDVDRVCEGPRIATFVDLPLLDRTASL
jgi:hypothetical protein